MKDYPTVKKEVRGSFWKQVVEVFRNQMDANLVYVEAIDRFLDKLAGYFSSIFASLSNLVLGAT